MKKYLCLEIETNKITALEVNLNQTRIDILKYAETSIPQDLDEHSLPMFIRDFLRTNEMRCRRVLVSPPAEDLTIRLLELPPMPEKDTRRILLHEFSSYKNFRDDYAVISKALASQINGKNRYLVVGARRTYLLYWIKILRSAGLLTISLESSLVAAYRFFCQKFADNPENKQLCFIQVNAKETAVFINQGSNLIFYRSFNYEQDELLSAEGKSQWLREINSTIGFFNREFSLSLSSVIINLPTEIKDELINSLSKALGPGIELLNIGSQSLVNLSETEISQYYATTLAGLALNQQNIQPTINLLPEDLKNKGKHLSKIMAYILIALLLISGFSWLNYYQLQNQLDLNANLKLTNDNLSLINNSISELLPVETEFNNLKGQDDNWKNYLSVYSRKTLHHNLQVIYSSLENTIVIEKLSYDGEKSLYLNLVSPSFEAAYRFRDLLIAKNLFSSVIIRDFYQQGNNFLSSMEIVFK